MAMTPSATVAATIVSALGVPPAGTTVATAHWTSIVNAIRNMVLAATVTVPATGITVPITGAAGTTPAAGAATGTVT